MQRKLKWLLTTAVACGGMCLLTLSPARGADQNAPAAAAPNTGTNVAANTDQAAPLRLPEGIKQKDSQVDPKKLAEVVAECTEASMTKDAFDNIVKRFVDQDRNRMADATKMNDEKLNGRIEQLTKVWQDKYNQKFNIDTDKVFANAQSIEGEIETPETVANNWPVPATPTAANAAQPAASNQPVDKDTKTQGNIEKGRNVAVLRLAAEQGLPTLDISMLHEAMGWKIDLPNNRTAQQIHDDLLKHLTMIGENPGQLPANADDAYRVFAHHVLMAIYGVEMPSQRGG